MEMIACRRCGRQLKTAKSQAQGYGDKCLKAQRREDVALALADMGVKPETIRKAQEDIEDGAVVPYTRLGKTVFAVVSSDGMTQYTATPFACTCKAGQFRKYLCRHRVDAMIMSVA